MSRPCQDLPDVSSRVGGGILIDFAAFSEPSRLLLYALEVPGEILDGRGASFWARDQELWVALLSPDPFEVSSIDLDRWRA